MILRVDDSSPVPAFEQIRTQVRALVEGGVLTPGTRMPPIRQLAGDLGIATNTVQRAYRELEGDGLLEARGRHGTVVRAEAVRRAGPPAPAEVLASAEVLVRHASRTGMGLDELLHTVRVAFTRFAS